MLVFKRSKNEQVVIGEGVNQVIVTVTAIEPDRVKIGFEAGRHIPIHRREVYNAIQTGTPRKPKG